jgi:hypothetical protein
LSSIQVLKVFEVTTVAEVNRRAVLNLHKKETE